MDYRNAIKWYQYDPTKWFIWTCEQISFPIAYSVLLTVQEQAQKRPLILVSGFMEEHPGRRHLLIKMIGKDATTAFVGGVHDHSNAAHNLLAMKRVGVLHGDHPHGLEEKLIPPSQSLKIARYNELSSSYASSSWSDSEGMIR
ncbi:hypothetical protein PC9H_011031 [Pleurotus ostreatus]|uniref:Cytochrome b5 heme-binding domain-containing protein n=2 Tax=Pleurotus TaxID=5320 RepID=A0A8H6ZKW5_PLEOS|nr:uncharacterized protein PC9H_011031 [Pleurotus ostreatus]KAF7422867.1 hypothetical protein PC9H_011031 [Pleurotus ostreatus]KAG9227285.1 hypothetical protein CCMSSC00406_0004176 [Pleurotus cornucopiae]KAJ8691171.1 stearoyl-CoA 9-desaturase [Pleurotus ostreatus]